MYFDTRFVKAMVIVILFILFNDISFAQPTRPVAEVTDYEGNILLSKSSDKKKIPCFVKTLIYEGNQLIIGKGASVTIVYYSDMHTDTISGKCIVKVCETHSYVEKGSKSQIRSGSFYKGIEGAPTIEVFSNKYAGAPHRLMWGDVKIMKPFSKIISGRPDIQWQELPNADDYQVTLFSRGSKDIKIFTKTVSGDRITYPADQKSLSYGSAYLYEIKAIGGGKEVANGFSEFKVASADEIKKISQLRKMAQNLVKSDNKDVTPYTMLFSYCIKIDCLEEALGVCKELAEKKPKDKNIRLWLAKLYELNGLEEESKKEQDKAGSLK